VYYKLVYFIRDIKILYAETSILHVQIIEMFSLARRLYYKISIEKKNENNRTLLRYVH